MSQKGESLVVCPGCGLKLASADEGLDERFNASLACQEIYWQLSAFTLSLQDPDFVHQWAVDAYAAQHSGPKVKPISTAFALIGLYLALEGGYTGKQVQQAHVLLGRRRVPWPRFERPVEKAGLTVLDVVRSVSPEAYREPIRRWAESVWNMWQMEHERVAGFVARYLEA